MPIRTALLLSLFVVSLSHAQETSLPAATTADPIAAILDAFRSHSVVALGEGDHGNEQGHLFRLALLRDPRFAAIVNDIVVEFGNARYQTLMDQFIEGGEVPYAELRKIWQDTSQAGPVWDAPIYEDFFRAVRKLNATLPATRHLRVLLGDPPIEWGKVESFRDITIQMRDVGDRDTFPMNVIKREVIAKGRRALIIYGGTHFERTVAAMRTGCQDGSSIPCYPGSIIDQLESATGIRTFTIHTVTGVDIAKIQADAAVWPIPSLTILGHATLGAKPLRTFLPPGPLTLGPDGKPQPESPAVQRAIEQVFDAVLYLGPPELITYSRVSPELCADSEYIRMRRARMALLAPPGSAPRPICNQ